jgi:hypothetical protein
LEAAGLALAASNPTEKRLDMITPDGLHPAPRHPNRDPQLAQLLANFLAREETFAGAEEDTTHELVALWRAGIKLTPHERALIFM